MKDEEQFNNEEQEQPQIFEIAILIDEANIADYVYAELIDRGLAPTEEEANVLGEIFFDWLIGMGLIEDFEEYDEE